ncbi:N-acetylglucosamine kinase [Oceanobacillus limi]|uniref:N-acetylglucosamine kinase n=1 Tax=Oceanobacillus limi TaxID=930131 RepID=UPI00147DFDB8|nr:BadF/BadG/BcrA/BcrD ATPase family protein [Oceanobacillus limi]
MYVIGIDGGGTKTIGVLADENGTVVAKSIVGPTNPNSVSNYHLKGEFGKLFMEFERYSEFSHVQHLYAGMSGVDHPENNKLIKGIISSYLPKQVKVTIDHDAITALYSGTLGEPGIVQISGTGSITFGMNQHGERQRVGGWGYLFSDYGSGYSIGRDALSEAFLAYDGLKDYTYLIDLLQKYYNVEALPETIKKLYQGTNPRTEIASLSRLVMDAYDHGDKVAEEIIWRNGVELGRAISALGGKLFQNVSVPVVLTGGVFNRMELFEKPILHVVDRCQQEVRLIKPRIEPIGGAIVAAWKEENRQINDAFMATFKQSLER